MRQDRDEVRGRELEEADEPVETDVGPVEDAEETPFLSRDEVRARSELAVHLRPSIFPADRDAIVACAEEEDAPPELLDALRGLPECEYHNVEGVWEALGGRRDERSPEGDAEDPAGAAAPRAEPTAASAPEPAAAGQPVAQAEHPPARVRRFEFEFDPTFRVAALPFLVRPDTASVVIETGRLVARFGRWRVETPVTNIEAVDSSGPYARWKTMGPARLSVSDRGLTFATNAQRGACIKFREPVRGIDPLGLIRHRALTVTVADPDGLGAAVRDAIAEATEESVAARRGAAT